ncbi:hypothetical protein ECC36_01565 [Helicobacter pylori]|nr:hypothetical protein ECC36_01565 [Helicobacter pylori]
MDTKRKRIINALKFINLLSVFERLNLNKSALKLNLTSKQKALKRLTRYKNKVPSVTLVILNLWL